MKRDRNEPPEIGECGVCGCRSVRGAWFESGQRDRYTRETPCDNFICDRCQARMLRYASIGTRSGEKQRD
jgi:hypothetical protein